MLFGAAPARLRRHPRSTGKAGPKHARVPRDAILNKFCFITEDRQNTGLFLTKSIAENVAVANMVNTPDFIVRPAEELATGEKYRRLLATSRRQVTPRPRAVNLSGGNQQKVVLGKWFNTGGEIYIFDEPSHGVDVGSKQEIYKVMVDLLKDDKAILMVSSDMPEVISMSDRVIVFRRGESRRRTGR